MKVPNTAQLMNRRSLEEPGLGLCHRAGSGDTGRRPYRLAILISHPVQYFSPLFRRLARHPEIDLTVLYCSLQGAQTVRDPEFGVSFAWDTPLLDGHHYKRLRNYWPGQLKGFFGCINPGVVTELREGDYDALIVFGWGSLTTWLAFGGARLAGTPCMLYGDSISLYEAEPHRPSRKIRRRLLSRLFRDTGAFLISGAFNRKFYDQFGVPADKCFDVPFAVDASLFGLRAEKARRHRRKIRAKFGILPDQVLFLFVGKLATRKRPRDLLDALKDLRATTPDVAAAFVGEGEQRQSLESEIAGSGLNNVYLLGFRNQTRLPEIYAMADVLVLPSSTDPKPLVVNEAMVCGLPVIVSDRTGVWGPGDIVRHGENGFVYPCGDIGALARAIRKLATDPELRRRMGNRSQEIIQGFGYDRCVEGILSAVRFAGRQGCQGAAG